MSGRLIISMLDLVERPLGRPRWNEAVTRLHRPERKRLEALLLDPRAGGSVEHLDLRYPGATQAMEFGEFATAGVGDIDGDGRPEIVIAVTPTGGACYVMAHRYDRGTWRPEPINREMEAVDFIRSMALGDLDGDGCDEIVIGTRPDGATLLLHRQAAGYVAELIDSRQQGAGISNVREVTIGDLGGGRPEVFTASARSNTRPKWDQTPDLKWDPVPGHIFRHHRINGRWQRTLVEQHGGVTHTRVLRIGELAGAQRLVSCSVGVYDNKQQRIDPAPVLRMHTLGGDGSFTSETIDVLEEAIMCRSMAIGDIDGDGRNELVVGTRSLAFGGRGTTFLYAYKHDPATAAWTRMTLDTSEPLGFRSLILADLDGDGRLAVIASDDGKGLIKAYRLRHGAWQAEVILSRPNFIFCTAMGVVSRW
ncbi:FG-GAP-like repeat-containing protein [Eleftheria terrae]|uniref:FG-GAP-like repeat-containing protein n=1 Tax=Eleftheria terrae TaxID=1597781 RepID=UPI00263A8B90|nr:FG-GAP-like repeat-containing protein [Eleftheria terrae]WKB55926.1 VCBS repeat-containing protein [Eleftheria terrae]